jgi:hypothetical protein
LNALDCTHAMTYSRNAIAAAINQAITSVRRDGEAFSGSE